MKNNNRILVIVVLMAVISFMCLTIGVSYSYVTRTKASKNAVSITTGNLSSMVTFNTLSNTEIEIMEDDDALSSSYDSYGTFQIDKSNVYTVFYYITVGYATTGDDLLPFEYLKVALYSVNGSTYTKVAGPVRVADLPIYNGTASGGTTPFGALYTLGFGTFATGSASKAYALKAWLDSDTPDDYDSATISLGVVVDQITNVSNTYYNFSGTIVDSSSNAVTGATVKLLQNEAVTATSASEGSYTLSNVPTGTWTLQVVNGNDTYETMIHVKSGSSVGFRTIGTNTGAASTYLQASAYTYYTTPYKILTYTGNSLTNSTNGLASGAYTIPVSYEITGTDTLSVTTISSLNMTLNANGTITLAKV